MTGYPSIDKPWLSFYSEESAKAPLPNSSIYEYILQKNQDHPEGIAGNSGRPERAFRN